MSDITTPNPESLTLREALEATPGLSPANVMEVVVGLLSSTNAHAIRKGSKLAAELAHIVIEEEQGFVAAVSPDDLRRMGAAFAAVILNESARFDWKAHQSVGGFLQQMYERHPEAREALITGATLNARGTLPCITCKQAPRRPNQRTCKGCHAEAMRKSRRRKRAQVAALTQAPQPMPWSPEYPKESPCEWCGEMFKPERYGQRFCSNVCGGKHATAVLKAEQQRRAEGR